MNPPRDAVEEPQSARHYVPVRARLAVRVLRAHLRTPLACLCYMVLLVAAAVGVDHAGADLLFADASDFIPAYRSFPEYAVGSKLNQFEHTGTHWNGLFIGNSRTMFDVDPATFDRALAARRETSFRSYNLAFPSIDPRFWPSFFKRYYDEPLPRHVFLGILTRDIEARNRLTLRFTAEFRSSPGFAHRHMSSLNTSAEEALARLYILRGRGADLRNLTLSDVFHGRKLDIHAIHLVGTQGWSAYPKEKYVRRPVLVERERRLGRRHGSLRFELGSQWRSVLALNSWLRARGSCLTLYTTPLLYDDEVWGTIEMRRAFYSTLPRLLRAAPDISFVDVGRKVEPRLRPSDYVDGDHLGPAGTRRFSQALARSLAPSVDASCDPAPGGTPLD
jgi:hypothetical protein